jgi:phosphopantetheinyl transferase
MESEKHSSLPGLSLEKQITCIVPRETYSRKELHTGIRHYGKAQRSLKRRLSNCSHRERMLKESGTQIALAHTKLELAGLYLSTGNRKKGKVALQAASDILFSHRSRINS